MRTESAKLVDKIAAFPDAMRTIMVSPTARPKPSPIAAAMPDPAAGMTTIRAEVPMAEILTYAQSLTSLTGGRGECSMHFLRYEDVPSHIAQKVIDETQKARDLVHA